LTSCEIKCFLARIFFGGDMQLILRLSHHQIMQPGKLFLILTFIFTANLFVFAEDPGIRISLPGGLTLCKKCGHMGTDTWRGVYRIENISGGDLVIYGSYDKNKFIPDDNIQSRNPDVCEWRYGSGRTADIQRPADDKKAFVLKPGQFIESELHYTSFLFNVDLRRRLYISKYQNEAPQETFFAPFTVEAKEIRNEKNKILRYEDPKIVPAVESCDPGCKLSLPEAPGVLGIKLGMSLNEFRKLFPGKKIDEADAYKMRHVWLWNWEEDAYSTEVGFLHDAVARIETKFRSLENAREKPDYYSLVAGKLGLEDFWTHHNSDFECKEFIVHRLDNQTPTISVWTREYLAARDKRNEDRIKNKK